jgi:hypothetical protein
MPRTSAKAVLALAGAALLGACSGADALTAPMGTTVASVQQPAPAAEHGVRVVREGAPMAMVVLRLPMVPPGFVARVAELGGEVVWTRGGTAMVAGLTDGARAALLRLDVVEEIWTHRR